jgi:hypothetical protein
VPALFWSVLGIYCAVRAWPPPEAARPGGWGWALATGLALGLAVLVRYGAALLFTPLLVYGALRWAQARAGRGPSPLWLVPGFVLGLLPQGLYYLTHAAGAGYSAFLSDWDPANMLRTTLTSADGTSVYDRTPLEFYLLTPWWDHAAGFLSLYYVPLGVLGLAALIAGRRWAMVGLLGSWWTIPALFFSGTPYEAHRFVLAYLPALTILIGIGGATALEWALGMVSTPGGMAWGGRPVVGGLVLFLLAVGGWQTQQAVRGWVATQAGFQEHERQVAALAREAADASPAGAPRLVGFGLTTALYYYTGWPAIDLYNYDEAAIARFLAAPGPAVVVVPPAPLAAQWAGTPTAARWRWLQTHYTLHEQSTAGEYTVYRVDR